MSNTKFPSFRRLRLSRDAIEDAYRKTNTRLYFTENSLVHFFQGVKGREWLLRIGVDFNQGFGREKFFFKLRRRIFFYIIYLVENILGKEIYVEVDEEEKNSFYIEPRFLKIIQELKESNIIKDIRRGRSVPDWPIVSNYYFFLNPIERPRGKGVSLTGSLGGSGFSSNEALASAIAETLERYSLCLWNENDIVRGSYKSLRRRAINPSVFRSFSDTQLGYSEFRQHHFFDDVTKFDWAPIRSLINVREYLIPAQLLYIGYQPREEEPLIRHTTTSGAAAGDSWERAAYSAITETVERDAFVIFWLNKIVPPEIDPTTIRDEKIIEFLKLSARYQIEIKIFDITTEIGVPTFWIVALSRKGGPAVRISVSSDLDANEALRHAMIECTRSRGKRFSQKELEGANKEYPFLLGTNRGLWWSQQTSIKAIEWLFSSRRKPMREDGFNGNYSEKLKEVIRRIKSVGYDVYMADVTSPLSRKYNIYVAKSLIPGFVPLYLNENYKCLGIERLYSLPVQMGFLNKPREEEELNPIPHPMP